MNQDEAGIVRRIFEMYAAGHGITSIAKALNDDHVVPPRVGFPRMGASAVREIIRRPIYLGITVWNRTQSVQRGGTRKQRRRPETEWLRREAPELRIIAPDLLDRVQARI